MLMAKVGAASLLFLAALVAHAEGKNTSEDVVVTGKKISKEDLAESHPVAAFAKEEIMSLVTTGKPACKNGSVGAEFDGVKFRLGDEEFTTDQLLERLAQLKNEQEVSCFHVKARQYDKNTYQHLEKTLVDQKQISLFWDEVK